MSVHGNHDEDAEVLRASLQDPSRFETIFARYFQEISRFIARNVSPGAVEDLTSETFIAAYRSRARFDSERKSARPWLFGIANNVIRHHYRSLARHSRITQAGKMAFYAEFRSLDYSTCDVDERTEAELLADVLAAALDRINPESREALLLFAADLSYAEIAEALGLPIGTIRSRIHRARAHLRELLADSWART